MTKQSLDTLLFFLLIEKMAHHNALVEEDFSLEFVTHNCGGFDWDELLEDTFHKPQVLQQRIIIPQDRVESFRQNVSRLNHESKYAHPLILLAKKGHPISHQAIVVRPRNQNTHINRIRGGVRLLTPRFKMLVSEPIYAKAKADQDEFSISFDEVSRVLVSAGMVEADLARTWFYLEHISDTYGSFNRARRDYFSRVLSSSLLPASTGVGGVSDRSSAVSVVFWAVSGEDAKVMRATSPLQCEPTDYAILFSRAICVTFPLNTLLLISGTASIDSQGKTLHAGDCRAQMARTLTVLSALLQQYGGTFKDIVQAVIYVKREEQIALCENLAREAGFPLEQAMVMVADMCREELLCEIEAHAVIRNQLN